MTDKQFDLVTKLLRMSSKPILAAARLVLVHGKRQVDAVTETGCDRSALVRQLKNISNTHSEIIKAYIKN